MFHSTINLTGLHSEDLGPLTVFPFVRSEVIRMSIPWPQEQDNSGRAGGTGNHQILLSRQQLT